MCGIIVFAGKTNATAVLLDGLERLEYRGYDSAGIAVISPNGKLQVKKGKGRLAVLRELVDADKSVYGNIGIGHTRWATHGEPNDVQWGILCSDYPDQMIAARKDAPLLIGYGDESNYIASDVTALLAYTRTVTYMEDDEVAVITAKSVQIYDSDRNILNMEQHTVDWDIAAAEKGGYTHFMLKEIMEQPEAVKKTISPRLENGQIVMEELSKVPDLMQNITKIYIVACGSAYHVGMIGKYVIEKLLHIPVEACLASEFRYSEPVLGEKSLVIVTSQSGETLDSMAALREAKRKGSKVLSIVNVMGSSIARESDIVLYTWAGPEIAVATTKAYSTQMVLLIMLGVYFAKQQGLIEEQEYQKVIDSLLELPEQMTEVLKNLDTYQKIASRYFNHNSIFFIGCNLDYALGLEGSLKLKEISYIHSESYAAGELKHGTISLIEPGTLVVALATYVPLVEKSLSNIVEVQSRGAEVIALVTQETAATIKERVPEIFAVPQTHPILQPMLGVIPLQLFAYYVALNRGCDIDKPRNLAKSVTVE